MVEGQTLVTNNSTILGHGVDLVEVARIQEMIDRHGERFLNRVFTADELAYSHANLKRTAEHLAVRFAAKEAVLKALGTGWRNGIAWTDVEVLRETSGKPSLRLHGKVQQIATDMSVSNWFVSLSHTTGYGLASVIAAR